MPAQPTPIKKLPAKREIRRPSPTSKREGKLPKGPIAAKSKVRKPMEPLEEKEQVVEEEQVEQVITEAEVQTAQSEQPQSHEVELMMIPVKNYTNGEMPNEEKETNQEQDVAAQPRRRMSSESSDHKRRFTRGDSEVKIEDILTRVFEDITAQPKEKPRENSQPKKSPAPVARKPPIAKPAPKPVAAKPTKPPAPKPPAKAPTTLPKKPAVTKVVKKEPAKEVKPVQVKPPTPEPVEAKPTLPPPAAKKPSTVRAPSAGKQPLPVKKVTPTPPKAALPKKTAPMKKLP